MTFCSPAGWTDEYKDYESIYDPSVVGHWTHDRFPCEVTAFSDGTFYHTYKPAHHTGFKGGYSPSLLIAFQDAELLTGRFVRVAG